MTIYVSLGSTTKSCTSSSFSSTHCLSFTLIPTLDEIMLLTGSLGCVFSTVAAASCPIVPVNQSSSNSKKMRANVQNP